MGLQLRPRPQQRRDGHALRRALRLRGLRHRARRRASSPARDSDGRLEMISRDCRVRALLSTADGGAIAVAVMSATRAEVVKFDAPP